MQVPDSPGHSKEGSEREDRSSRIARTGPEFFWQQIADDLIAQIESGRLPPGTQLPREEELATIYGVARETVRKAKKHLIAQKYIVVAHGRGSFVRAERQKPSTS